MKKIEQLYRAAPVRNSPDSLDKEILRRAALHAERVTDTETGRPLLSSWMPIAASFLVVGIGLGLVLRSGMVGTGGDVVSTLDGYPEASSDADGSQSRPALSDSERSDPSISSLNNPADAKMSTQSIDSVSAELPRRDAKIQRNNDVVRKSERISSSNTVAQSQIRTEGVPPEARLAPPMAVATAQLEEVEGLSDTDAVAEAEETENVIVEAMPDRVVTAESVGSAAAEVMRQQLMPDTVSESVRHSISDRAFVNPESGVKATEPGIVDMAHSLSLNNTDSGREDLKVQSAGDSGPTEEHPAEEHTAEVNSRLDTIILIAGSSLDWLGQQTKSSYTLQLATADDDNYLAEFAQSLAPDMPRNSQFAVLALPTTNADSTQSFSLMLGVYSTFEQAENALEKLPSQARRFGARVRNFGVLQKAGR